MNAAACTIVSPNYLAYARTLASSYIAQHPGHQFFVLIVADLTDATPFRGPDYTPVMLDEIGVDDVRGAAMKFDILELNTNVKPAFLKHLFAKYAFDVVTYLDPDIFCYAPLTPVFDELARDATAVLTPHFTTPVDDGHTPSEQDLLVNGTYNLGFVSLRQSHEASRLLDWWSDRCLNDGFSEGRTGLFVDQKWMNLAPGLFADVAICRHAGCNMAYWNLHERTLAAASGAYMVESPVSGTVPLCFFHFSGIAIDDPAMLSKNTDRFTLASRPDLTTLFADYKRTVIRNRDAAIETLPYGFDRLSDGTTVTALARRIFAQHRERFSGDPFDANLPFAAFARAQRLVKGTVAPPKARWKDFNPSDRRVNTVHTMLRLALRVLGPHRYELLMRYLAHISVLRHQSVFLRDENWPADKAGK